MIETENWINISICILIEPNAVTTLVTKKARACFHRIPFHPFHRKGTATPRHQVAIPQQLRLGRIQQHFKVIGVDEQSFVRVDAHVNWAEADRLRQAEGSAFR